MITVTHCDGHNRDVDLEFESLMVAAAHISRFDPMGDSISEVYEQLETLGEYHGCDQWWVGGDQ